jgi:hypothetical protein
MVAVHGSFSNLFAGSEPVKSPPGRSRAYVPPGGVQGDGGLGPICVNVREIPLENGLFVGIDTHDFSGFLALS